MNCETCGKEFFEDWRRDRRSRQSKPDYCSRKCSNSRQWDGEHKEKLSKTLKDSEKQKIAVEARRVEKLSFCVMCGVRFSYERVSKGKGRTKLNKRLTCSTECYHALCKKNSIENEKCGGQKRYPKFVYKGICLQSSYEVKVAISLDENNISWSRPPSFLWEDNEGIKHRYYPDFYLPEYNVYLDPKNDFLINDANPHFGVKDSEKIMRVMKENNIVVLILNSTELTWDKIRAKINLSPITV